MITGINNVWLWLRTLPARLRPAPYIGGHRPISQLPRRDPLRIALGSDGSEGNHPAQPFTIVGINPVFVASAATDVGDELDRTMAFDTRLEFAYVRHAAGRRARRGPWLVE